MNIMKQVFFVCLFFFASAKVGITAQITMTVERELTTQWEGFGYNQWGYARQEDGNSFKPWDDQLWETTKERILAIKPSLVRLPLMREWFNKTDDGDELPIGTYNWTGKYMQAFYKIMDLYKENDISVMSGLWHSAYEAGGKEPTDFYKSQYFAILQADLIDYLINTKGYTNIKFYTPTNEPLGSALPNFDTWKVMMKNLYQELSARDLPTNILIGADSWGDWTWLPARENKSELSGYDFHHYLNDTPDDTYSQLYDETLETNLSNILNRIYQEDNTNKPVLVTEIAPIGVAYIDWPVESAPAHCRIDTYEYGLGFWDYAIQLTRSGMAGGLAWALDGFDQNKNAGMWNNSGKYGGMKLRPWYYTWQLMSRYFPTGAKILKMAESPVSKDLRIAGARIGSDDYSFVVVNRRASADSHNQNVIIKADGGAKTFYVYEYSRNHQGDGYSLSLDYTKVATANLKEEGIHFNVPLEGGVLITTQAPLEKSPHLSSETNFLDFESDQGYILLDNNDYAVTQSKSTNPRKREPNVSDNVCRIVQNMPSDFVFNPNNAHSYIVLDSLFEVKTEASVLTFQYYRSGYSTSFIFGLKFSDDSKIYGADFETINRSWEEKQINLGDYVGRKIESFVMFPNIEYGTLNVGAEESISVDNIQFLSEASNASQPKEISIDVSNNLTSNCNFTFEQKENSYFLSANQSCGSVSLQTNPSKDEVNQSDKVVQSLFNLLHSDCKADAYSVAMNPYPYILVTKDKPYLHFNVLRADYPTTVALEIEFEGNEEKSYRSFEVLKRRTWENFDIDLSTFSGRVIKNIRLYPNVNPNAEFIGNQDNVFFDNIRFAPTGTSAITDSEDDGGLIFYVKDNRLFLLELESISQIGLYSSSGKVVFRGNSLSSEGIPLSRGVFVLTVDNRSYKVIN